VTQVEVEQDAQVEKMAQVTVRRMTLRRWRVQHMGEATSRVAYKLVEF
jgi:hypothetical protein